MPPRLPARPPTSTPRWPTNAAVASPTIPIPARLGSRALGPRAGLWDRTGEPTLRVRVGVGTVPAEHPVRGRTDHVTLPASPVVIELDAATGIVGPREPAVRLARWIVGQLALRYSPAELAISLAGSAGPDSDGDSDIEQEWGWVRLLPHGCDNDDASAGSAHRTVVIVDGTLSSSACDLPRPQEGVHVLALAGTATTLPSACTQIIDLTPAGPRLTGTGPAVADLVPDGVPGAWTTLVATRLAPLRDAAAPARLGGLPAKVTLQELLLLPQRDGIPDLARVWREDPRSTRAPLGVSALGPLTIDLVRDGPHALVGGTTGSGKSELLVSLVAALAAGNRPDELCFVLVDYKGGAAFGACRDLPHVVGLVTDLDHQLTERALVSLGAELKRRERVFGERGVGDLAAYQRVCRPSDPAVPRLVIIVDEFRSLAEELPDFVAGLVRVASLGRSLGVHLVVATQRPAGVVTADMRANLGLRIALRVRDAVDSFDVVESPVAATIAANTPGRAVVTSAAMPLTLAQTALATAPRRRSGEPGIRVLSVDGLALPPPAEAATEGPTELDDLVAGCRRAVDELGISVPASPWLAPLPAVLPITDLGAGSGWPVPLGLRDLPAAQRQAPWTWDPLREGHLGIVGAPRTGRTSALSTLAAQLATRFTPTELHLYAVHTGSLLGLESLPHVGASVRGDDLPRLAQLLSILRPTRPTRRPRWCRCVCCSSTTGTGSARSWTVPAQECCATGWQRCCGAGPGSSWRWPWPEAGPPWPGRSVSSCLVGCSFCPRTLSTWPWPGCRRHRSPSTLRREGRSTPPTAPRSSSRRSFRSRRRLVARHTCASLPTDCRAMRDRFPAWPLCPRW